MWLVSCKLQRHRPIACRDPVGQCSCPTSCCLSKKQTNKQKRLWIWIRRLCCAWKQMLLQYETFTNVIWNIKHPLHIHWELKSSTFKNIYTLVSGYLMRENNRTFFSGKTPQTNRFLKQSLYTFNQMSYWRGSLNSRQRSLFLTVCATSFSRCISNHSLQQWIAVCFSKMLQ